MATKQVGAASVAVKPSFHYPSWRPINSGAFFDTRQLGPSWRVSKNAPELMGRQLGLWTWVVETGLYKYNINNSSSNFWPWVHEMLDEYDTECQV